MHFASCRGVQENDTPEEMHCPVFTVNPAKLKGNDNMTVAAPTVPTAPGVPGTLAAPAAPAAPAAAPAPAAK